MEDCIGGNGRQLFVRVDCKFGKVRTELCRWCNVLLYQYVLWQTMQFLQWINKVVPVSCVVTKQ